jgi:hypothetical protein
MADRQPLDIFGISGFMNIRQESGGSDDYF